MMDWGEDPSKWVIQKAHFGGGWYVAPPNDGEGWIVPEFPFRVPEQPSDPCTGPQPDVFGSYRTPPSSG